jgi:hypothetical protein
MSANGNPPRARSAGASSAAAGVLAMALSVGGCATDYDLTLMPRDSGKLVYGTAHDVGAGEASVSIDIGDKTYRGTWVQVTPDLSGTYVGASAWGWGGWGPYGEVVRGYGDAVAKALLQAADGTGLRCDFFGLTGGQGTGKCIDDKGLVYDVQIRSRKSK